MTGVSALMDLLQKSLAKASNSAAAGGKLRKKYLVNKLVKFCQLPACWFIISGRKRVAPTKIIKTGA